MRTELQLMTFTMSGIPKVYVTRRNIPQVGVDLLRASGIVDVSQWDSETPPTRDDTLRRVTGAHALFCFTVDQIDAELLDAAGPQLRCISTMSVGHDHVDLDECRKRNISVGYTPHVLTSAVAELTVTLVLATSRRLKEGMRAVESGSWGTWNPIWMLGQGLEGSTVGVVGLGRIGKEVVKRLRPFGVATFLYVDVERKEYDEEIGAMYSSFDQLLEQSDCVICCCSLTQENVELFNRQAFMKMKKNAIFINTSRGRLVNQDDLYHALVTNQIAGAGLDVTTPEPLPKDSPLLTLDNCLVLPHRASATHKTRQAMSQLAAENILAFVRGENMPAKLL